MEISVIIPIYNVKAYLRRCLSSVEAQSFTGFEAVLVDDGSTDGSMEIEREFAARDVRFRIVAKENGGVASARNAGIAAATGEYIAFVDADDFVEPDFLETLFTAVRDTGSDIACCNFNRYFPRQELRLPHLLVKSPAVYNSRPLVKSLLHDTRMQSYLWNKLWRRTLFTDYGVAFPNAYFEDTQVVLRLFYHARRVVVNEATLYNYTQRDGSIVHTFRPEVQNDFLTAVGNLRKFLESHEDFQEFRPAFHYYSVKSMFFLWGAVGIHHWQERNFRGFLGNLVRIARFLAYCSSPEFRPDLPLPEVSQVFRAPHQPTRRKPKEFAPE